MLACLGVVRSGEQWSALGKIIGVRFEHQHYQNTTLSKIEKKIVELFHHWCLWSDGSLRASGSVFVYSSNALLCCCHGRDLIDQIPVMFFLK